MAFIPISRRPSSAADLTILRPEQLQAGRYEAKELVIAGGGHGSIRSENYDPTVPSGWALFGDGSAIFNTSAGAGYLYGGTISYTADGTFDKGDYPGLRAIRARVQAAGGAGGGAAATGAGQNSAGGGGGGGAYAESLILVAALAASETVTVAGTTAGGTGTGSTGGSSSFGSHVVCAGGSGGTTIGALGVVAIRQGGPGGVASAGDLRFGGSTGQNVIVGLAAGQIMGPGGGASHLGGGGRSTGSNASVAGNDGRLYGGGGGGAGNIQSSGSALNGGDGAAGIVIIDLLF